MANQAIIPTGDEGAGFTRNHREHQENETNSKSMAKTGNAHLNSEGGSVSMADLLVLTG